MERGLKVGPFVSMLRNGSKISTNYVLASKKARSSIVEGKTNVCQIGIVQLFIDQTYTLTDRNTEWGMFP